MVGILVLPTSGASALPAPPIVASEFSIEDMDPLVQRTVSAVRASSSEDDRRGVVTQVRPAKDLNGDGHGDVLGTGGFGQVTTGHGPVGYSWSYDGTVLQAALDGRDGTHLWARTDPGAGIVEPSRVGPDGSPGTLVITYRGRGSFTAGIERAQTELRVTAIDGAGTTVWTRIFSGSLMAAPGIRAVDNWPLFGGLLNAVGNQAVDLLVSIENQRLLEPAHTDVAVLDGADGRAASTSALPGASLASVYPAPDLSRDDSDDYLVEAGSRLSARRGTDGQIIWSNTQDAAYPEAVIRVGDSTGDQVSDVALMSYGLAPSVTLIDGRDGSFEWTEQATDPRALGDVDGDGRTEVGIQTLVQTDGVPGVRYAAFRYDGTAVYDVIHPVAVPPEARPFVWRAAGDVDGDGRGDALHGFIPDPMTVVSGRTGQAMWTAAFASALHATVDGHGDDMFTVVSAREPLTLAATDGATGASIWNTVLAGRSARHASATAGDLDGDGLAEVLVAAEQYGTEFTVAILVLSGSDGTLLWSA